MELGEAEPERFPLAGKWYRRLMILWIALMIAWFSLGPASWYSLLPGLVIWTALALAELYAVIRGRGDYVELLADGILLVGGTLPTSKSASADVFVLARGLGGSRGCTRGRSIPKRS